MAIYTQDALDPVLVSPSVRIRCEYDAYYEPQSWIDKSDPESEAYCMEEAVALERGDLVVIIFIREEKCQTCEYWHVTDSLHGCVFDVKDRDRGVIGLAESVGFNTKV